MVKNKPNQELTNQISNHCKTFPMIKNNLYVLSVFKSVEIQSPIKIKITKLTFYQNRKALKTSN